MLIPAVSSSVDGSSCSTRSDSAKEDPDDTSTNSDRDALFLEFTPLLKRLVRLYGGTDQELRDDLQGEMYWRFATYYDEWDQSRGVPKRPYLVCKLNAAAYTFARKRWREQRRETSLDINDEQVVPFVMLDPTDEWNAKIDLDQHINSLPRAIVQLPERQRIVLLWRYYGDRSYEDIAHDLSITQATARSLLRHGINRLRKHLLDD